MPPSGKKIELLAPAGGPAQLSAALEAGADAVYFGTDRLNMRMRATNFSLSSLQERIAGIHEAGARAFLTLNTLVFESELPDVQEVLEQAKEAAVDAVIAADWAVIRAARRIDLPVHVSTQLSVSNSQTLAFLFELGIRRVVLARECSLEDVMAMKQALKTEFGVAGEEMEFEVFAHGAMCVAESGRCFLSGHETGRSASRGDCAQPCRRPYTIQSTHGETEFQLEGTHVLSPKDLCTLPFLNQILDAGVCSLKIEGRNRSPDYVHTVVSAYRAAIDAYQAGVSPGEFQRIAETGVTEVKRVYNRGFSSGYYLGRPMNAWTTAPGNQSTHIRSYIGQVIKTLPAECRIRIRLESGAVSVGDEVFFEGPETGFQKQRVNRLRQHGAEITSADKGEEVDLIADITLQPADKMYRYLSRGSS